MIKIKNLHVKIDDKEILKGIDLEIKKGEIHALMGPNGNGKSTLLMAIMGHPKYEITSGDIIFEGKSILDSTVDERSRMGIFLAMQSPQIIPGVTNLEFLKYVTNAHSKEKLSYSETFKITKKNADDLKMNLDILKRFVNDGFSGGEKKKNEILQLKTLSPKLSLIDEIDSGLDVDALEVVSNNLRDFKSDKNAMVIVSHYDKFFNNIEPTHAHVIMDGKIIKSGNKDLVTKINTQGYEWLRGDIENAK